MQNRHYKTVCRYKDVDVVHIFNPRETLKAEPGLKRKILAECDQVQRSVWRPKQSIEENTINNDLLFLLSQKDRYVGFLSAERKKISGTDVIHLHDVMIAQECQGMGYCRLLTVILVLDVFAGFGISKFYLVTATSNSRLIETLYTKHNIFTSISFPCPDMSHEGWFKEVGEALFKGNDINYKTGVIKNLWHPPIDKEQHITKNRSMSSLFGQCTELSDRDALLVISKVDEEAIVNANSYVRGYLNLNWLDIDL